MATENRAEFSSDGKSLAYVSNESGEFEIYVEPVPQTGLKRKVSRSGGSFPLWSPDGSRLFWVSPDREVWAASLEDETRLAFGTPELFLELPEGVENIWPFETIEGFLGVSTEPAPRITKIEIVLDFFGEIERLVPRVR